MTKNNAIVVTSIIAGVILVIALLVLFVFRPVGYPSGKTVTVQGISQIKAMPDLITVYFNVETNGTTSAEATSANSEIMDKLTTALIKQGFSRAEIQTQSFNVYPDIYWEKDRQKENGYKAVHSVKVELSLDRSDDLGEVIDAGVNAGAGVSYINFELTQESQNMYKAEALKLASQDAKIKADAVASGFGKSAGKLVSVSVNDFGYYPWNVYTSSGAAYRAEDAVMAKEAATNIAPSQQEITATVSATFKIA